MKELIDMTIITFIILLCFVLVYWLIKESIKLKRIHKQDLYICIILFLIGTTLLGLYV